MIKRVAFPLYNDIIFNIRLILNIYCKPITVHYVTVGPFYGFKPRSRSHVSAAYDRKILSDQKQQQ
jgi:hypothetical protein